VTSRRQLYAAGEPFGDSATQDKPFGRVYGGGGGGGGSSTTTNGVAEEFKPLVNTFTQQAQKVAGTPWQAYTGQRFADMNATQNMGIGMIQSRALNGSQTMQNAENTLNQFIQGGNTNPYLDSMVNKAQANVMGNANQAAVRSGSFGNSGIAEQAAKQMGDIATNMYGNAYSQDQSNRMNALGMAPTFGNAAYQDAGQLINAGNMQQQNQQNKLDFGFQQYQDAQNHPFKQLQSMGSVVGAAPQSSTTTQSGGGK
jgi:hypothetical protein